MAVDMVWTQFAITSPSHTIIHVHSGSCSKPCYSRLFSCSPFFTPYIIYLPAYLDIMPFSSQSLPAVLSALTLHPHFPTTFPPPTPIQPLQLSHPSRFIFNSYHLQAKPVSLLGDLMALCSKRHYFADCPPLSSLSGPVYLSVL